MRYKRDIRTRSLTLAFTDGITSMGLLYPSGFLPTRYPGSYGDDMEAIGRDMWRAVRRQRNVKSHEKQTRAFG